MWNSIRCLLAAYKPATIPPITSCLIAVEHASYAHAQDGNGILFDELHKQHWHLNHSHFLVALTVAADRGQTRFTNLARSLYPHATDQEIEVLLNNLWETRLFKEHDFRPPRPPLGMIIEFALFNFSYRVCLRIFGWKRVVSPLRLAQLPRVPETPEQEYVKNSPSIIDQLLAAAQLSYGLPTTSALCVPVALTFHRMLKRRGYASALVVGSPPAPLLPHIWIELDGHVIDTLVYQYEENRYRGLSDVRVEDIANVVDEA